MASTSEPLFPMFDEERIMPFQYCPSGNVKKQVQPGRLSGT
jgi:hypothetical protein